MKNPPDRQDSSGGYAGEDVQRLQYPQEGDRKDRWVDLGIQAEGDWRTYLQWERSKEGTGAAFLLDDDRRRSDEIFVDGRCLFMGVWIFDGEPWELQG